VSTCRTVICREQMKSEQGCLERVLQVDTRHLPWARRISRSRFTSTKPGRRIYATLVKDVNNVAGICS